MSERRSGGDTAATSEAADDYKAWYEEAIGAANEAGYGPCSAADAIRGLAEEVAHYKQIAEKGTAPLIESMKLENGHFDLSVTGPIVEAISCAFVGQFKEGGSTNYMEMSLFDRDEPFQRYTVTVQKVGANSPADLVNEERKRVTELRAEASFLLDRLHELNLDDDTDDLIRDWNGHVEPSIARLRALVGGAA